MTLRIDIHPDTPQPWQIARAVDIIAAGGVLVYPTDSCYALGCAMANPEAVARIRNIRQKDRRQLYSLVCRDLSEIATYARVGNQDYRLLKKLTPGPYTFILKASGEVPKRLLGSRRKTIGIRVPAQPVAQALLAAHGEPLLSSTAHLPGDDHALSEPDEIAERLQNRVDAVIDSGSGGIEPTSVIDLTEDRPRVVREGAGDVVLFDY